MPTPITLGRPTAFLARRGAIALVVIGALLASVLAAQALVPDAEAQDETVVLYDEALRDGLSNWSWADADFAAIDVVAVGARSIRVDMDPWEGLYLGNYRPTLLPPDGRLVFALHPGDNPRVDLGIVVFDANGTRGPDATITTTSPGWQTVEIPLDALGEPATLGSIWWQELGGRSLRPIWLDDISIAAGTSDAPSTPPRPGITPGPTLAPEPEPTPTPTATPTPTLPTPTTTPLPAPPVGDWAFEETFDGNPSSPSQDLLPRTFDYMVTHRTHPQWQFEDVYDPYPADHGDDCAGPNPDVSPLPSHLVTTSQAWDGSDPDESFFICKNHMMSSMGDVDGYSLSAFWPRQEFDFADGGLLEFEVNINEGHTVRHWWEVMIAPRDQLHFGAGPVDSPIDETYPDDRIVLQFRNTVRRIGVGTGAQAPDGWLVDERQFGPYQPAFWRDLQPGDPASDDRRIRRTMQIRLDGDRIVWGIETAAGDFDEFSVDVPGGIPFDRGVVMFKTHSYTPGKDRNTDVFTFHWDDIRFDGPVLAPYSSRWADAPVDLQRNGDRPIGDEQTVTIDLPSIDGNPVLAGQLHQPIRGQVLLSINGGEPRSVELDRYDIDDCHSENWKSFRMELDPTDLVPGENTFTWIVGERPACTGPRPQHGFPWDGFSVKALHVQLD